VCAHPPYLNPHPHTHTLQEALGESVQRLTAAAAALNPADQASLEAVNTASVAHAAAKARVARLAANLTVAQGQEEELQARLEAVQEGDLLMKCAAFPSSNTRKTLTSEQIESLAQEVEDAYRSNFQGLG
jgi:hypothetical protein